MKYVLLPFIAWVVAGSLKFTINALRFGKHARAMIGYGGFPSTHTTIVSSAVFLVGLTEGFQTPVFSMGLAFLLLVVIDAHGLRNKVGMQAQILNKLQNDVPLRESMGHRWYEIIGGLCVGFILAFCASKLNY